MGRLHVTIAGLLAGLALLLGASTGVAGEPPNRNDPCSSAGRNTCGTTGKGFYENYRYGLRWFGDYRNVVPGEKNVFCIDLRYWYPGKGYKYIALTPRNLRNRDGQRVPVKKQRQMAYAMWAYGRSNAANRQAAVMLYVHEMMDDGAPGEVNPASLDSRAVQSIYRNVARDAARYHGPYRIDTRLPKRMTVGAKGTGTVRVLSASGRAVPNLTLSVTAQGARGVPTRVRTGSNGVARLSFTAADAADGVRVSVTTPKLPSTLPELYIPTDARERRNAQRVAAPDSQTLTATKTLPVAKSKPVISTKATPQELLVGEESKDEVTVRGIPAGTRVNAAVRVFGPFRTREEITCDGSPAATSRLPINGSGTLMTEPARFDRPGWYAYQLVIPETADLIGLTTPCGVPEETLRADVQPTVTTVVSAQSVRPGTEVFDTVRVSGLVGESATVSAALYGPFPTREAITCDGAPFWTGEIQVAGDGDYATPAVKLDTPAYYTYVETIAAQGFVRTATHPCGEVAETTVVVGSPQITTQVSDQTTSPGDTVTDQVVVTGLGSLSATVQAQLWGPFPTREAIRCDGTPFWSGSFTATGDGTYTTEPVTINAAGYYTYTEQIAGSEANDATATECGLAAETTLTKARPKVRTIVSNQLVRPGSRIFDRVRVSGAGSTPVEVDLELYGPYATRAAMRCTGTPMWKGTVTAKGDGQVTSPRVRVPKAGFYTYRESVAGSETIVGSRSKCGVASETSLATPAITTGRGEQTKVIKATSAGGATPTRVRVPALGIDAPIVASGIDVAKGELGVPANIRRTGWWRDSKVPGSKSGNVLIAGHLDSATAGGGAFFRLPQAERGERIQVRNRAGRTYTYRVTSVRSYLKAKLPTNVFATKGSPKLVLVTCGGPFQRSTGFYRDNIVITAVPA